MQAQEMAVDFSFDLDGRFYRWQHVIKGGGAPTSLELWSNSHTQSWLEGTIRNNSTKKIIDTLHLSFETFSNSAFIQGLWWIYNKGPTDQGKEFWWHLRSWPLISLKKKQKKIGVQTETLIDGIYQLPELKLELSRNPERESKKR